MITTRDGFTRGITRGQEERQGAIDSLLVTHAEPCTRAFTHVISDHLSHTAKGDLSSVTGEETEAQRG